MGNPAGSRRRPATSGFTLVELLLTVGLLLLLAAAAVFNFDSLQRGSRLEEGASLAESLFRYSRAQAAGSGRTLRLVFEPGASLPGNGTNMPTAMPEGVQVLLETDPLNAPGQFEVMPEAVAFTDRLNELVEIRSVRLPSAASSTNGSRAGAFAIGSFSRNGTNGPPAAEESAAHPGRPPLAFYPDGSSDSAELVLVSRDPEDSRRLVLTLSGMVGTTRRKWLIPDPAGGDELESDEEPMEEGDQ